MPGTGIAYAAMRYAMSGTDVGYAATRLREETRTPYKLRLKRSLTLCSYQAAFVSFKNLRSATTARRLSPICLRVCYAMPGLSSACAVWH
eukprot:746570-Rhodomonas_salina.1